MPQPQTYYRDDSESNVKGVVVVEDNDEYIRVTENRSGAWCPPFQMPEDEFKDSVESRAEAVGILDDGKYEQVLEIAEQNL